VVNEADLQEITLTIVIIFLFTFRNVSLTKRAEFLEKLTLVNEALASDSVKTAPPIYAAY
jgi:hypothetical protein